MIGMSGRTKPLAQSYHPWSNTDRVESVGRAEPAGLGQAFLSGFLGKSGAADKNQTFIQ